MRLPRNRNVRTYRVNYLRSTVFMEVDDEEPLPATLFQSNNLPPSYTDTPPTAPAPSPNRKKVYMDITNLLQCYQRKATRGTNKINNGDVVKNLMRRILGDIRLKPDLHRALSKDGGGHVEIITFGGAFNFDVGHGRMTTAEDQSAFVAILSTIVLAAFPRAVFRHLYVKKTAASTNAIKASVAEVSDDDVIALAMAGDPDALAIISADRYGVTRNSKEHLWCSGDTKHKWTSYDDDHVMLGGESVPVEVEWTTCYGTTVDVESSVLNLNQPGIFDHIVKGISRAIVPPPLIDTTHVGSSGVGRSGGRGRRFRR